MKLFNYQTSLKMNRQQTLRKNSKINKESTKNQTTRNKKKSEDENYAAYFTRKSINSAKQ